MKLNKNLCNIVNKYSQLELYYVEHNMPVSKWSNKEENNNDNEENGENNNDEETDYTEGIHDNMEEIIYNIHCHIDDLFEQNRLYCENDDGVNNNENENENESYGVNVITCFPVVENEWLKKYKKDFKEAYNEVDKGDNKVEDEYIMKSDYNQFPIIDDDLLKGYKFEIEILDLYYHRLVMYSYTMYMFYYNVFDILCGD